MTKEQVLSLLEQAGGESKSGEAIARELGVSRAAVWKAIAALRREGYTIEAVTNRGYRLCPGDVFNEQSVRSRMQTDAPLLFFEEIPSTNTVARQLAMQGAPETILLAQRQTAGRGRMGRPFQSPSGGLYVSVLLRPAMSAQRAVRLTLAACVGVRRAVERATGFAPGVKWVNDLYLHGKKICGILTEAATDLESGGLEYAVVGVGLNFTTRPEEFPAELRETAGSIFPDGSAPLSRSEMAALFIDCLWEALHRPEDPALMQEYRAASFLPGHRIDVVRLAPPQSRTPATALGVDEEGRLLVRYDDGREEALYSGEVSIRSQTQE